ncbi:MAG: glycosyl transferase [Acidobacteria bacterium]|nr:glycosyl transferase [Acidobacteriota bacterium]
MADFYQTGVIATLHRLAPTQLDRIEAELYRYSRYRPIALVLPALYSELEGPALPRIVQELAGVGYLQQIVVALARADEERFHHAKEFFSALPVRPTIIWNDGPNIQRLYALLEENGLPAGSDGKGRSCWMAYGYVLASRQSDIIALHDCDIVNYTRELLARLCYPVVNPNIDYEFCKGYYARVTDRMHGRVTRLLMSPLIRSLIKIVGPRGFLRYLDSFRYPLAGEFSMKADLARANRIPSDWGLEVGVLAEVYRNCAIKRICQAELCENYEHKHQDLSPDDPGRGLSKMGVDIAKNLFRTMAAEGIQLTRGVLDTLSARIVRQAEDTVNRYHADALINGLRFDRHLEETAVAAFANAVKIAAASFLEDPLGAPLIPNWNRITSALPDFFDQLLAAVNEDNAS